jgi:hypothetical protein
MPQSKLPNEVQRWTLGVKGVFMGMQEIACTEKNSPESCGVELQGKTTKAYLEEKCRWRRVLGALLVRSKQVSIVSSLSANLFREVYRV